METCILRAGSKQPSLAGDKHEVSLRLQFRRMWCNSQPYATDACFRGIQLNNYNHLLQPCYKRHKAVRSYVIDECLSPNQTYVVQHATPHLCYVLYRYAKQHGSAHHRTVVHMVLPPTNCDTWSHAVN
ncbi:hypothetical protein J6590_000136 [Homalodisca vitripennis]|nr:hypothetical protein J6590_000136 [Homalodisca vitripennis]